MDGASRGSEKRLPENEERAQQECCEAERGRRAARVAPRASRLSMGARPQMTRAAQRVRGAALALDFDARIPETADPRAYAGRRNERSDALVAHQEALHVCGDSRFTFQASRVAQSDSLRIRIEPRTAARCATRLHRARLPVRREAPPILREALVTPCASLRASRDALRSLLGALFMIRRRGELSGLLSSLCESRSPFVATRYPLPTRRGASPDERGERPARRCESRGGRSSRSVTPEPPLAPAGQRAGDPCL